MQSQSTRDRLVYPVAAILALGLISVPHHPVASTPRLAEISAIRLQAEATSYIGGLEDAVVERLTSVAPAAAAATSSYTYNPAYTPIDNFLSSLPTDIRNALLPPLYAVAWVIGLVLAPVVLVTSALFGWPVSLRPAAANSSVKASPAPAEAISAASDPVLSPVDPGTSSVPGETANADDVAAQIPAGGDDIGPRARARGTTAAEANPIDSPVSPQAPAPAVTAIEVAEVADRSAAPADEVTPTATATKEVAPVADRPAHARGRLSEAGSTASAPAGTRPAKRSVR